MINKDIEMNVLEFFDDIEKVNDLSVYRHINVELKGEAKIPIGEKNDMSVSQIAANRGCINHNTLSLAVKHVPKLYVVDFDSKDVSHCPFYQSLVSKNIAMTPTRKGYHFYLYINNIGAFSNQQKIHSDPSIDLDLIKQNNIWETKNRIINGSIETFDWNDIKHHFNIQRMNFSSPQISPPESPTADSEPEPRIYDAIKLQNMLNQLTHADVFEYQTWLEVGMAIHTITNGDAPGFLLYQEWSKKDDDNYSFDVIKANWMQFRKKGTRNGYPFLKDLIAKYAPLRAHSSLQEVFFKALGGNDKNYQHAIDIMLAELNTKLILVDDPTGFIIPTTDTVDTHDTDGKVIESHKKKGYLFKSKVDATIYFASEKFTYNGGDKPQKIDPFIMWCEWIDQSRVKKIDFDPRGTADDVYNIWNGFSISKTMTDGIDSAAAQPVLDHIKDIWADGDAAAYHYVMSYLAHIIQKPHIKTGVCLALKSKQGGGKGIILKLMEDIIGKQHYTQSSQVESIFGTFNGLIEGKILINLDEAFWGGDVKMLGTVKNKITESTQCINKKGMNQYNVSDFCNYIITTNNDWFAGVEAGDRRYYALRLNDKYAGRATADITDYYRPILNVSAKEFASVLYNWDLSDFNPRSFPKTELLQEQVEEGWCSVQEWWHSVMSDASIDGTPYGCIQNNIDQWGDGELKGGVIRDDITYYTKQWLFEQYHSNPARVKKSQSAFYKTLKNYCLGDYFDDPRLIHNGVRGRYIQMPTLDRARVEWCKIQQYEYSWD